MSHHYTGIDHCQIYINTEPSLTSGCWTITSYHQAPWLFTSLYDQLLMFSSVSHHLQCANHPVRTSTTNINYPSIACITQPSFTINVSTFLNQPCDQTSTISSYQHSLLTTVRITIPALSAFVRSHQQPSLSHHLNQPFAQPKNNQYLPSTSKLK